MPVKFKVFKIDLDGHSFQVDYRNPNKFYFIVRNLIYSQEFEKAKGFKSLVFKLVDFFKSKSSAERTKRSPEGWVYGEQIFFRSKTPISFFKFERDMQHFYCDDGKIIKRFQSNNKEVVNVYDEIVYNAKNMSLSADESLIYRWARRRH